MAEIDLKISKQEKDLAMMSHLLGLLGSVIPFGNIIAPLIIMLAKGGQEGFVKDHAREAVNFQISMTIYFFISVILVILIIGILGLLVIAIFEIISVIKAAQAATRGETFRYPLTIRFIK